MNRRSYGQYCGLSQALDLVGERWTLLIVRDLAVGPRRFGELQQMLPGIGTSMLSDRLRHLEDLAVAERAVGPAPGRGVVYRLTAKGEALARAVAPLTSWGATFLGDRADQEYRPDWLMFTLRSTFRREAAAGVHDCYEFRLYPDVVFWVEIDDGEIKVTDQRPRKPDFTAELDIPTLADIGQGELTADEAVAAGRARFHGNMAAGARALDLLGSVPPRAMSSVPRAATGDRAGRGRATRRRTSA